MKDVMTSSLRRPSFSNALAELPEVEEAGGSVEKLTIQPLTSETGAAQMGGHGCLPPIGDQGYSPEPLRPRLYTVPETSLQSPRKINRLQMYEIKTEPAEKCISRRHSYEKGPTERRLSDSKTHQPEINRYNGRRFSKETDFIRRSSNSSHTTYTGPRRWSKDPTTSSFRRSSSISCNGRETETHQQNGKHYTIYPYNNGAHNSFVMSRAGAVKQSIDKDHSHSHLEYANHYSQENETTDEMPEVLLSKRRWSNPSFALTSRRVSQLLKWKEAGKNRMKKNKIPSPPMCVLPTELPESPRFSSYMSPEAQYATMKGYEDIIYDKLSQKYPEYHGMLRRNRTPSNKINIRRKECNSHLDDAEEEDEEDDEEDDYEEREVNHEKSFNAWVGNSPRRYLGPLHIPDSTKVPPLNIHTSFESRGVYTGRQATSPPQHVESSITLPHPSNSPTSRNFDTASLFSEPPIPNSKTALQNLRRMSSSWDKPMDPSKLFEDATDEEEDERFGRPFALQRCGSLPAVCSVSHDRRRALTQSLERAMDIVDVMKGQGELLLSPRVKGKPRRLVPLTEYNHWSTDWNREFKVTHSKA